MVVNIQIEVFRTLKMYAARSSETSLSYCSTTQRYNNTEGQDLHPEDGGSIAVRYVASVATQEIST
jgi:hypothetical protein